MPIARTLAIALMLVSLLALAAPAPGHAASRPVASAPSVAILGGLFGEDENEPDENEPEEGGGDGRSAASTSGGSGTSFSHLLLALGLGAVAMAFATRWFFRLRSWVRR